MGSQVKRNDPLTIINRGQPLRGWVHEDRGDKVYCRMMMEKLDGSPGVVKGILLAYEEGTLWARGFDADTCAALRAAYNLSEYRVPTIEEESVFMDDFIEGRT